LDGRESEGEETGYRESRYIILAERRKVMSEMKKGLFMDFATGFWYTADLGFGSSRLCCPKWPLLQSLYSSFSLQMFEFIINE
jgi:hypothetical protein